MAGGWIPVVGPGTGHRLVGRRRAAGGSAVAGEAFGVISANAARKRAASSTASASAGCGIATADAARKRAAAEASRGVDAGAAAEIVGERAVADEATGAAAAKAGHVVELDGKRCRYPTGE